MVVKKKMSKKTMKKQVMKKVEKKAPAKKVVVKEEVEEEAPSVDDALDGYESDDEPIKKDDDEGMSEDDLEKELDAVERAVNGHGDDGKKEITIEASKPIAKVKKGDKIHIDGKTLEVDAHYVLIDHGTTKEMAIEMFETKTDKDYQLRYFDDQAEMTLDLYELQDIMYFKKPFGKISW